MYRQAYIARRLFIMIILVFVTMALVWLQVVRLQVVGASDPESSSETKEPPLAPMGTIVDRNGLVLAIDAPSPTLYIAAYDLSDEQLLEVKQWLEEQGLGADAWAEVLRARQENRAAAIPGISRALAQAVEQKRNELFERNETPWLWTKMHWVRVYPNWPLAFHVLGYRNQEDPPRVQGGVHAYYKDFLAYCRGLDPDRKEPAPLPGGASPFLPSPFRCDLVLTIDATIQYAVEQELDRAIETYEPHSATAIVMDPRDGSILALASRPVFDPKRIYTDPQEVGEALRNRSVSMLYEPGSVVKAITFATAYDAGIIREDTLIKDEAELRYAEGTIRNSQGKGYGLVDPGTILALSLNVATARVAIRTGPDIFYRYLEAFGFGRPTEVDMANEYAGIVRWPGRKDWSFFDLATNSFGQGISVTPMQLIRAMAVLANGGILVRPHVLEGYYQHDTYYRVDWSTRRRVIQPRTARVVTGWLVGAVEEMANLGIRDRVQGMRVAGKTGTAEIPSEEGYTEQDRNVTFVGYFPADDPRVIILVMMERPQKGPGIDSVSWLWAFNTAYPTFVHIANAILPYLDLE